MALANEWQVLTGGRCTIGKPCGRLTAIGAPKAKLKQEISGKPISLPIARSVEMPFYCHISFILVGRASANKVERIQPPRAKSSASLRSPVEAGKVALI